MIPRRRRSLAPLRWGGALLAATGLVALTIVGGGPAPARAASTTGYDQMSGVGNTASAITVPWTSGLLDSSNEAITAAGSEINPNGDRGSSSGPTSFMDSDFSGLSVTVSQTQDIGHGGITVTWNWPGHQTQQLSGYQGDYLQMMECYGDASTGPSPEDCEFGAGLLPSGAPPQVGTRQGDLCSSPTLSTTNPTGSLNGDAPAFGCDPYEPTAETPTHFPCTASATGPTGKDCVPGGYNIPFVPVDSTSTPLYQQELPNAFDQFSTNEVDLATTRSGGTGQQQFETLTSVQSSGLGCGQQEANGTPQGCWLVIVPRGSYEPNGFHAQISSGTGGPATTITTSPLSAVNWAQRIQVHLDYAPLPTFCGLGDTGDVSLMEGSQLVTRAVESWELKLNEDSNCARTFHLAETPEQQVTNDFTTPITPGVAANAMAFTTDPIGADRLRNGEPLPTLPKIVYAPVAIMAIDFGFNIDEVQVGDTNTAHVQGYLTTPVELTPQLAARALTQSYRLDLPDYDVHLTPPQQGPAWSQNNPPDISHDPTFQQLNPEVIPHGFSAIPLAPLDTIDHSAYYQQVWQWMQADPSTAAWLNGTANSAVSIDPAYSAQNLGTPPAIDSMPRSYQGFINLGTDGTKQEIRRSIDMLPYVTDFDAASADVLSANPLTYGDTWDPTAVAPDGTSGYWEKNPAEPPGQAFIWAMDATPYLAAYGIVPAALCNDSGGNCLTPTVASVTAAVNDAKPDSSGLLQVNPASPGTGAYPLTEVVYAAVRTDASSQQLSDYADFISYAANQGQTPGQAGGDLPSGYLPLTTSLQQQATAAVTTLRTIAAGGSTATGTPTTTRSGSASPTTGGPSTATTAPGSSTSPAGTTSTTTPAAAPNASAGTSPSSTAGAAGATPTGPVIIPPTVALQPAGNTPGQPVGAVRLALVIVVIVGLGGAGGGILLRRGRVPRWPGRWGT